MNPADIERLYRQRHLSRRQFVAGLAALGLSLSAIEGLLGSEPALADAPPIPLTPDNPQYLVVIVLDAFRPDYMELAPMPAVQGLMKRGMTYERAWVGQLESETPVGHASLSTGAFPRHDGVIGFEWRDPKSGSEALDGWPAAVYKGVLEHDLQASGSSSIPMAVKAADPAAKVVSISSEKVYAADAMGGPAADYILYHSRQGSTGPLTPTALAGHAPDPSFFQHPGLQTQLPLKHFTDWDYLSAVLALAAFDAFRPRVLMVNFPGADVYGHPYGGPAAPTLFRQIVEGLDRNIGRIVSAYDAAGILNQTLFVVTADHGMVPNDRSIPGSLTKETITGAGGQYLFHTGGTAADIYLKNPDQSAAAVAAAMAAVPNTAGSYFRTLSNGQYSYETASGLTIDPALDAAYQYLLGTFAGATSPDVVVPFRENTIGTASKTAHGDHGGLNWGAQHIPLIMAGPGVKQGTSQYPARLIDVAPTVLRLMGINGQPGDGVILADAINDASAADVSTQTTLGAQLTGFQDALIMQALDNVEEDQRNGMIPPAPAPARP